MEAVNQIILRVTCKSHTWKRGKMGNSYKFFPQADEDVTPTCWKVYLVRWVWSGDCHDMPDADSTRGSRKLHLASEEGAEAGEKDVAGALLLGRGPEPEGESLCRQHESEGFWFNNRLDSGMIWVTFYWTVFYQVILHISACFLRKLPAMPWGRSVLSECFSSFRVRVQFSQWP